MLSIKSYSFLKVLCVSLALFGYGLIGILLQQHGQVLSFSFRCIVLVLSLLIIFSEFTVHLNTKLIKKLKSIRFLLLFLFIALYTLRLLWDLIYSTDLFKDSADYLITWFGITLVPFFVFLFIDQKKHSEYLNWVFAILLLSGLLSLPLAFGIGTNELITSRGRLSAEGLNPISLGLQSGSLLIMGLFLFFSIKKKELNRYFYLTISSSMIGLYMLIASASRGPIISAFLTLILLFSSFSEKLKDKVRNLLIVALLCTLAFILISNISSSGISIIDRFSGSLQGNDFDDTVTVQRPTRILMAIELAMDNPLLGFGLEVPGLGYPHNLLVESFLSMGVFGGFLFFCLMIIGVVRSLKLVFSPSNSWKWIGLLFFQYFIASLSSGSIYGSSQLWYLLGLVFLIDL